MDRMQVRNASGSSRALRLDLLHTFEVAARRLSFTLAGEELFLSQSAVSRQIQQLEESVGVPLFERRHRAIVLTEAGRIMQRAVQDSLERLRDAAARVRAATAPRQVTVTCTPGFASFWLIPRLPRFSDAHPEVDVRISATLDMLDLDRSAVDVAVRFVPVASGAGSALFEEEVQPLCAPRLLRDPRHPLRTPADLAQQTLLTIEMPGAPLTVDWEPWLQVMGLARLDMARTMRFTQYSEAVAAAVAGQGVVIGRLPLLGDLLRRKELVAPFASAASSRRGYFVQLAPGASHNPDAQDFARWLLAEAQQARVSASRAPARSRRPAPPAKAGAG